MMDEASMLKDAVASLLRDRCSMTTVRTAEDEGVVPVALWASMRDNGFTRLSVSANSEPAAGTLLHDRVVLDQAARAAAPLPLAEDGMLGAWLLISADMPLPDGIITVAPGLPGDHISLEPAGSGWRLTAELQRVPYAASAQRIVALYESTEGTRVISLPVDSASVEDGRNVAGEPRNRVFVKDVVLDGDAVALAPTGVDSDALRLRGALARAAQLAAAAERVMELTIEYTNTREQFGRKIVRFQAVARHVVRVAEHTQLARMAVSTAFANAVQRIDPFDVAAAKTVAGEAAAAVSRAAHQAHGAIGMTKEYELGQLTRRLWAWRDEFGSDRYWSTRLGAELAAGGAAALWPRIAMGLRDVEVA